MTVTLTVGSLDSGKEGSDQGAGVSCPVLGSMEYESRLPQDTTWYKGISMSTYQSLRYEIYYFARVCMYRLPNPSPSQNKQKALPREVTAGEWGGRHPTSIHDTPLYASRTFASS